ncbi:hypothetical protein [Solibacillus sp. CAU 1738]|uniref:hypothetical protein n=1 Tax=Solibacillus sp. CAU 1738 TaxID=3140363 RepID=UPI003260135A
MDCYSLRSFLLKKLISVPGSALFAGTAPTNFFGINPEKMDFPHVRLSLSFRRRKHCDFRSAFVTDSNLLFPQKSAALLSNQRNLSN